MRMFPTGDAKPAFTFGNTHPFSIMLPDDQLKEWLIFSPFQLIFDYNILMSSSTTQLAERHQRQGRHETRF